MHIRSLGSKCDLIPWGSVFKSWFVCSRQITAWYMEREKHGQHQPPLKKEKEKWKPTKKEKNSCKGDDRLPFPLSFVHFPWNSLGASLTQSLFCPCHDCRIYVLLALCHIEKFLFIVKVLRSYRIVAFVSVRFCHLVVLWWYWKLLVYFHVRALELHQKLS